MGKTEASYLKIDIQSLKIGEHEFNFEVGDGFFESFENSPLQHGKLNVVLKLVRSERLLEGHFSINGTVELECDRSLELFDYEIQLDREVIFKYGEDFEELDEYTVQIPRNLDRLDISTLVFEMIVLEIPMRKIHPKYTEEGPENTVYYSTGEAEEERGDQEDTDPRWSALKGLDSKKTK